MEFREGVILSQQEKRIVEAVQAYDFSFMLLAAERYLNLAGVELEGFELELRRVLFLQGVAILCATPEEEIARHLYTGKVLAGMCFVAATVREYLDLWDQINASDSGIWYPSLQLKAGPQTTERIFEVYLQYFKNLQMQFWS